jgi:hypothetical protein
MPLHEFVQIGKRVPNGCSDFGIGWAGALHAPPLKKLS